MKLISTAFWLGVMLNFAIHVSSAADGAVGEHLSISVTNKSGDVFRDLVVAKVFSDGLVLEHKAGQLKVKFADLPQDVREKYEPLAAAAQDKEQQKAAGNAVYVAAQQQAQAEEAKLKALRASQQPAQQLPAAGKL